MDRLMRASEIIKRPVVTMAGDDIAQIKDIVYGEGGGAVVGFTLAGRGLLAGPLKQTLPWRSVSALGADAVMIMSEAALGSAEALHSELSAAPAVVHGSPRDVLGSEVLTDDGSALGSVVDVIIEVGDPGRDRCDVVGYEISASDALGTKGTRLLIPLPDTLAASGEHLIVPASAKDFVQDDLAGFGAAIEDFRAQLGGTR